MDNLSIVYPKILEAIKTEISEDSLNVRQEYEHNNIIMNWHVGRSLERFMSTDRGPSKTNAKIVEKLCKDLVRPATYFYGARKFYNLYPTIPKKSLLTWCHYNLLIRIKDDKRRRSYEELVLKEGIGFKELGVLMRQDNKRLAAEKLKEHEPDEWNRPQLKVSRGRLYHYKVTAHRNLKMPENVMLVDIGFGVFREVFVPTPNKIHAGYTVRVVKAKERYGVKLSGVKKMNTFTYKAHVERVVDGDTLILNIDCGFQTWVNERVRLRGIDAPELKTAQGAQVKLSVQKILAKLPFVIVKTYKQDKFGRMLADIFYMPDEMDIHRIAADGIFLNQELIDNDLAKVYEK